MSAPREDRLGVWLDGFLRSYAQVFFSSSRSIGLIFLLATMTAPLTGAAGAVSVAIALMTARLLNFSDETGRMGLFGYNSLLVGLAIGAAFPATASTAALVVGAAVASVIVTAAARSFFATFGLPPLSLPFLVIVLAVLAAAPALGLEYSFAAFQLGQDPWEIGKFAADFLVTLGSLFFVPTPLAGLTVLVGILVFSRIALSFCLLGYLIAFVAGAFVAPVIPAESQLFITITMVVLSVALGGIWFVPGLASVALVLGAGVVGLVFAVANFSLLAHVGFPILFLPLNITVWVMLYAMRQRVRDAAPKSVDFIPGSPEESLTYYRNHIARFGAHYLARFRVPFLGAWIVTQGPEGEITHRGYWKHAVDFEVSGKDGQTFEGTGERREDYHCYGLPVVSPADGTVVRVVDDVADNDIGEVNLAQNWGNVVLIYHGPGVYSLVAHLMPGRTKVIEGQTVRRGDEIGRCGNSGRSPVPHLHFQLQASPVVGAPTIITEFHDVVAVGDHADRLRAAFVPDKGAVLRNMEADTSLGALFGFDGQQLRFETNDGPIETLDGTVDLLNRHVLESSRGARLFYNHDDALFTIYDVVGGSGSMLHLMRLALGRVPFELDADLEWHDHVPLHYALSPAASWLLDFVSPFLPDGGLRVEYTARATNGSITITGVSETKRDGEPWLKTCARIDRQRGIQSLEVDIRGKVRRATRLADE